jgi:hypothetical protein
MAAATGIIFVKTTYSSTFATPFASAIIAEGNANQIRVIKTFPICRDPCTRSIGFTYNPWSTSQRIIPSQALRCWNEWCGAGTVDAIAIVPSLAFAVEGPFSIVRIFNRHVHKKPGTVRAMISNVRIQSILVDAYLFEDVKVFIVVANGHFWKLRQLPCSQQAGVVASCHEEDGGCKNEKKDRKGHELHLEDHEDGESNGVD